MTAVAAVELAVELGTLQPFACPVCGRLRPLSKTAARAVVRGESSGECATGHGCRTVVDRFERLRRFWLVEAAGIAERDVRAAGGAAGYVERHGLPEMLVDLAAVLPAHCELVDDPHAHDVRRPSR